MSGRTKDFKLRVIEHAKKYGVSTASSDMNVERHEIDRWLSEEQELRSGPRSDSVSSPRTPQPRQSQSGLRSESRRAIIGTPRTPLSHSDLAHRSLNSGYASCITNDDARREAVLRLQEKYARDAQVKAEKDKEKEERKRKERLEEIAKLEEMRHGGPGQRLGSASTSFRQEYNPLMGNGSTCSRAPARKPARGG